jgi:hypothetical protein
VRRPSLLSHGFTGLPFDRITARPTRRATVSSFEGTVIAASSKLLPARETQDPMPMFGADIMLPDKQSLCFGRIEHPALIALPVMQTAGAATKSNGHCIRRETSVIHGRSGSGIILARNFATGRSSTRSGWGSGQSTASADLPSEGRNGTRRHFDDTLTLRPKRTTNATEAPESPQQIEMIALTEQIETAKPGARPYPSPTVAQGRGRLAALATLIALVALFLIAVLPR